jgi:hypothetical protein
MARLSAGRFKFSGPSGDPKIASRRIPIELEAGAISETLAGSEGRKSPKLNLYRVEAPFACPSAG